MPRIIEKTVFSGEYAGFPVVVKQDQTKAARFTVIYGKQVRSGLTYVDAATELGLSLFHALACDGVLTNDGV